MSIEGVPSLDAYRAQARRWLADNLKVRRDGYDVPRGLDHKTIESIAVERSVQRRLYLGGYAGITWPSKYGGQGLTEDHAEIFRQEAEVYHLPEFGVAGRTTLSCAETMLSHATDKFLTVHIPRILSGDELWVQFLSEPAAGSDLAGVLTRADRDGDRWILNGSKIWSSGAYYADYGMCLARTDWAAPKHRGLTWFAVKIDSPGVTVRPLRQINGDAEFCEEFFDDVELDDGDRIGEVNDGWRVAQTLFVFERSSSRMETAQPSRRPDVVAPDLRALADRVGRLGERDVRQLIAQAHINDIVLDALNRWIEGRIRGGGSDSAAIAAYRKLAKGVFDPVRGRIGLEVGGLRAVTWDREELGGDFPSLNYLNCRIQAIAGGSNEMMRNTIAERVLGLPREPGFDRDRPFAEVLAAAREWWRP